MTDTFFGKNLVGQEPWQRRGENEGRIASLETSRNTDEAKLALINTMAWTVFTPTVTQSNSPAFTNVYSAWVRIGRTIHVQSLIQFTANGTATNPVLFTLPVAAVVGGFRVIGIADFYDASGPNKYVLSAQLNNSTTVLRFQYGDGVADDALGASGGFTAAVANNDGISLTVTYEAAS